MTKKVYYSKLIEVIETKAVVGKGTSEDPVRTVVSYWTKDGKLLTVKDPQEDNTSTIE